MNVHTWKNVKFSSQYKSKKKWKKKIARVRYKEQKGKNQQTYSSHECTCVTERRAHEILIFKKTHSFIEHHVQYILTHNRSHSHARTCSDYIVSIFSLVPLSPSTKFFAPLFLTYNFFSLCCPIWYYIKLNMVSCVVKTWMKCSVKRVSYYITCECHCSSCLSQQLNLNVS